MKPGLILVLAFAVLASCSTPQAKLKPVETACEPGHRWLSQEPMTTSGNSSWLFTFSVALIGCKQDLESIPPEAIEELQGEFLEPTKWSLLDVVPNPDAEVRSRVLERVNTLLGNEIATDIVWCCVGLQDHNAPLTEEQ